MTNTHRWRTSSYSGEQGSCVAIDHARTTARIRDSKSPDTGTLTFDPRALHQLVTFASKA